jgi:hypothetical protein
VAAFLVIALRLVVAALLEFPLAEIVGMLAVADNTLALDKAGLPAVYMGMPAVLADYNIDSSFPLLKLT